MTKLVLEPLSTYRSYPPEEMASRARTFYESIRRRRSVRDFSDKPVPREVIEYALLAAGTAPSGANLQPWHFTVITSPDMKRRIREEAEIEERDFYNGRAPQEWLDALAPLGTDEHKLFLETAPVLITIFGQRSSEGPDGRWIKNYYVPESVGIATGFLIAALHEAGLVTLTHTPSPMGFLNEICGRPETEKPYILLVVGYPAEDCRVPVYGGVKKPLETIASWL
ncbi:nitroreductase [Microvirga lupini]|uniref:Nitroreductase n=1 Tax=Microvirga lupini TaxID=420324 RepID=A0A7W4YVG6_9HYPH|nr:nitroreductase family protein [Microvirga lupini]MBB3017179.1 nitroreductase [Microvirga lupini]